MRFKIHVELKYFKTIAHKAGGKEMGKNICSKALESKQKQVGNGDKLTSQAGTTLGEIQA